MKASRFVHRLASTLPALALLAAITLAVTGCGGSKKESVLTGKVTYKDQPVTGGNVYLYPADATGKEKTPFSGAISPEGTYTVAGAPKDAEMKIVVETESVKKAEAPTGAGARVPANAPADIKARSGQGYAPPNKGPKYVQIPPQYGNVAQTPLRVKITGGKQPYDIQLSD